jgi:Zn-dependent peptidase ImmA (M78 family)
MVEKIWKIGSDEGLHFEFRFDMEQAASRRTQAWGGARLFFAEDLIWATETENDDEAPLNWSWFDLLEYLTNYWPWIVLEQDYPIQVNPSYPGKLYEVAESRWESFSEAVIEEEDMLVYAFTMRHDLALALKGAFVPSVMIMRCGNDCLISLESPKKNDIRPMQEVINTLEAVGNLLADVVGEESTGYAGEIVRKWRQKDRHMTELRFDILSGMDKEARIQIDGGENPVQFWEVPTEETIDDSELLAAARMTSAVFSPTIQKTLIEKIRSVKHYKTGFLDALAAKASAVIDSDMRPYEQGYSLAEWLRNELSMGEEQTVNPERILRGWNVEVSDIILPDVARNLDAVAAWGQRHGPVVIMNGSEGARCTHAYGRRTTLAHEICHLLLDRENGLPMAEVLGGRTPESLEQRAGAFAAEFLLPRSQAIAAMRGSGSVEAILDKLTKQFQVSREVAARQIVNSPDFISLYKPDQAELKRIISSF